jgi:hypothetical protein
VNSQPQGLLITSTIIFLKMRHQNFLNQRILVIIKNWNAGGCHQARALSFQALLHAYLMQR